jgi:PAS domain S-box-containing protein
VADGFGVTGEGLTGTAAVCHDDLSLSFLMREETALEIHHVVEAAGIIAFGVLFYSYSFQWFGAAGGVSARWRQGLNGLAFGLVAVGLMIARMQLSDGIFLDGRAVPIALVALFEGVPAAIVAIIPPIAYRIWLGGVGAPAGVAAIVAAAGLGVGVRAWARRDGGVAARHAFALGIATYVATVLSFFLAGAYATRLLSNLWFPLLVTYIVGIGVTARLFRDVADRTSSMDTQARFRAIIDEASDAIRIVDVATSRILDVNRADTELCGFNRSALIGKDVRDFWPADPEVRAQYEEAHATARAQGFARGVGEPYLTREGATIRVDSTRRIVKHCGHRYEIIIYRDAAQREAAEAVGREVAELRAIGLVASGAAHEINNPLAVVVGSLGLLERKIVSDTPERRWIDQAMDGAQRITDIVSRMHKITRVERAETEHLPPILDITKSSEARTARSAEAP